MEALRALYDQYIVEMHRYGMIITQDTDKVKDCIQDLFISLWTSRDSLTIPSSGKAYLMASLRRRIFDKGGKVLSLTDDMTNVEENSRFTEDHEAKWIEMEDVAIQNQKLEAAMNRLSERQREIIYMKFQQEMEYEEIGKIMDLNYQSARNLVNRALTALRKEMLLFVMLL